MPTVRTIYSEAKVKVAVVFKPEGGMCPVWFEVLGAAGVQVSEVTASWYGAKGATQVTSKSGAASGSIPWSTTRSTRPGGPE